MTKEEETLEHRILVGAERYAAADRTDPFALARIKAHIRSGIMDCPYTAMGHNAWYDAEEFWELRQVQVGDKILEYRVKTYRNVVRP